MKKYLVMLFLLGCTPLTSRPPQEVTIEPLPEPKAPLIAASGHIDQYYYMLPKDIKAEVEYLKGLVRTYGDGPKWFFLGNWDDISEKIDLIIEGIRPDISDVELTERKRLIDEYLKCRILIDHETTEMRFKVHELDTQFYNLPKPKP